MHEFQLSGRAVVAATVALALAGGTTYLAGLLIGLGWNPAAATSTVPAGPTRETLAAVVPTWADRLPGDLASPVEVEEGRVTAASEEEFRSATPVPFGRRQRGFGYRDPWFRFSDPVPLTPFGESIYRVSRRYRMSPQFVAAVVWAESAFDPRAVSSKGARGLLQVMPATGRRFGAEADLLFDPAVNLDVGVRYLRFLSDRYAGDMLLILAAYNAGEVAVDEYRDVPPFPETRVFVRRVADLMERHQPMSGRVD